MFERGKVKRTVRDDGVFGTLLGPEGTPVRGFLEGSERFQFLPSIQTAPHLVGVGVCDLVGVWLFFENYTVDASIFVVKLLRAYGGCLGTRSR